MQFLFPQKILFKHCDPAGIVFYPRYFEIINDCVEAFFDEALNYPYEELLKTAGCPTAQIAARFTAPSRHGDALVVALQVRRLGRSALDLRLTATCGDETRFKVTSTLVHIDKTGKPQPWPDALRARITPYTGDPEDAS